MLLLLLSFLLCFTRLVDSNPDEITPFSQIVDERNYPVTDIHIWLDETCEYHDKNGLPKRPLNAFILYKIAYFAAIKQYLGTASSSDISRACAQYWKTESPEILEYYKDASCSAREKHRLIFPAYRYRPKRKSRSNHTSNTKSDTEEDAPHELISIEEWNRL